MPVLNDCKMTRHGIGVAVQPNVFYPSGAIFLCPEREREIDARHPGASRFFLIHEYGHLAMRTREEAVADEWAAKQLAAVPAERSTLRAVLLHFVDQGVFFDPLYGTGFDRALRVARAAGIAEREWPTQLVAYAKSLEAKAANGTQLTLRRADGYTNAAQMIIYLDRQPIGFLSTVDEDERTGVAKVDHRAAFCSGVPSLALSHRTIGHKVGSRPRVASGNRIRVNRQESPCDRFSIRWRHTGDPNRGAALAAQE